MNKEEAARILDPVTAWKELEKYGPSTEQKIQAVMEAGQIAARELMREEDYFREITNLRESDHFRGVTKMMPLTLEQLQGMNGKLVWVEKYKTVGIICIKWNKPDDPLVLFWDEEPYLLTIKGCKLKVYAYLPARIDWEAWEKPCNVCCGGKIPYQYSNHVTLSINMFKKATFLVAECEDLNQDAECCTKSDQKYSAFKIHFCPECGRPLTDEAWEALEKRFGEYPNEI